MGDNKKVIASLSTYTIVSLFGSLAGFILMPFLTHYLSTEDYGTLALFNTYVQLLIPFISISAFGLVNIEHFSKKIDREEFRSLFSSISLIPLPTFVFFLLLSLIWSESFSVFLDIPANLIWAIPVFALLSIFFQQFQGYVIVLKKSSLFAIVNISKTTLEYILAVLFIIGFGCGWFGRVEAALIVFAFMVLLSLLYYAKWDLLTNKIEWKHIVAGIFYGYPLIVHAVGKFVINQSDKIFISKMVSKSELGVYNTGYLIGSIIMILSGAFLNVYTPFLFERLNNLTETKKIEIVRISYLFVIGLFGALILMSVSSPYFYHWFIDADFAGGVQYVFWTGLSYCFWGCYLIFVGYLFFLKKTKVISYLAMINIVLNLVLNYILIRTFGAIGAAYATAISFFVVFVLVMLTSNKYFPMPWLQYKRILGLKN